MTTCAAPFRACTSLRRWKSAGMARLCGGWNAGRAMVFAGWPGRDGMGGITSDHSLSRIFPDSAARQTHDQFVGSAIPFFGDRFRFKTITYKNHIVPNEIFFADLNEGRLHPDFQHATKLAVDDAWTFSQSTGIPAEDHAKSRNG